MNQSISDQKFHSFNYIDLNKKYEICRQQSQCYLLIPPPQPPIFPKLILYNSSSTLTNHQQYTQSFFIILNICIALISICLLVFLLGVIFQFYHKLRQYHRRTKHTNITDGSISFSKIIPTSCNSLTPLTTTTNQSPSSTMTNIVNQNLEQILRSDDQSSYHNHSTNIYEKIQFSSDHHYCSCCLCVQTYYKQQQQQQQQYISTTYQLMPYYYTYESSSSKIICQNCLLETLHHKQNCFCRNFFVPIK
ncbi:unnamed protein product [Rotaria sordida]|uniref:Uncharacterized protein n=1 Tax=Rotaria sordida TaxID=392033 RepID=A0A819CCP7_9BILA|nr:unnamed protein product [Rotaria sordida]